MYKIFIVLGELSIPECWNDPPEVGLLFQLRKNLNQNLVGNKDDRKLSVNWEWLI